MSVVRGNLGSFAVATKMLVNDIGQGKLTSNSLPSAFMTNGGWPGWKGPYLDPGIPLDPWDTPYQFRITGSNLNISSAGKDRKFGTRDDFATNVLIVGDINK